MNPIVLIVDLLLWFVQGVIMLVFVVPLQRTSQAMTWLSWRIIRYPYYRVVLIRRRITGRSVWQDSDLTIGIMPPESEWSRLGIAHVTEVNFSDIKEVE